MANESALDLQRVMFQSMIIAASVRLATICAVCAFALAAPVTASPQDVGLPLGTASPSATLQTLAGKMVEPADSAILDVMHRFDMAIRNHDASALKDLFYKQDIVWRLSLSNVQVEKYKKINPAIEPVTSAFGGYRLLDDERMRAVPLAERFYDPHVTTDGQIAVLSFDYDFTLNCKPINWGKETWQLVNTESGWRILSLLYSGYEPTEKPFSPRHAAPVAGCTPVPAKTRGH